jgi:hypothetical protein
MDETKLRVASITLFIRALIDELEPKEKARKSATAICSRGKQYVRKTFTTEADQALLSEIANNAYDDACTLSEMKDISVSTLVMCMFDSRYRPILEKEAKLNMKHFQSLYDGFRQNTSLKLKLSNHHIASWCLECINKRIYDSFTKKQGDNDGKDELSRAI